MSTNRWGTPARTACLAVAFVAGFALSAPPAAAQDVPEEVRGIDITPVLGSQVPLGRPFEDERGRKVTLGEFFHEKRPVLLVLAYYRCPMLCGLVLQAVADSMKEVSLTTGDEYEFVMVSIDPTETTQLAKLNHQKFVARYARPGAAGGIHFLVGREPDIRAVADAVGFKYRWNETRQEYVHAAGIFILTPDGELSQCITGLEFEPKTLKYSLIDASQGNQGSILDKVLLWCHSFDPDKGRYTVAAMNIMRLAGMIVLLAVAILVVPAWLRTRHRREATKTESSERG